MDEYVNDTTAPDSLLMELLGNITNETTTAAYSFRKPDMVEEVWKKNSSYFTLYALLWYPERRDDLIAVVIWIIMLTYAFVSNVLILIGIVRSNTMRAATSYWFIISLAVCDIVMTFISLIHLVPATAFHSEFLVYNGWRNIVMLFLYDLFWYTAVLQLGVMAGNRFVSIVYPMEYKWMFSRSRSIFIIFFGYFLGFLSSLPTLFPCCHTLWDANYYITVYEPKETWYKYVDMTVNSISLILMICSYSVIIYRVRESGRAMAKYQLTIRTRQQNAILTGGDSEFVELNGCTRNSSVRPPRSQVSKKEMRLFIQFFVVSLVFLLTWTTWQWLPHVSMSKWVYFLMTSLFFINNSVNPTVYLLFNTQLRRELHYLLCRHHVVSANDAKDRRSLFCRQRSSSSRTRNGTAVTSNNNDPNAAKRSMDTTTSPPECMAKTSICSASSFSSLYIQDRSSRRLLDRRTEISAV